MGTHVTIALCVLGLIGEARGQEKAPGDDEISKAISRGVAFLKEEQGESGEWRYGEQPQHSLGMTALAGLALLENGMAREAREISKAREFVATAARESNQTYDLALAILFLARCQQTRTGQDDSLIQLLGRRLAGGDHSGIWDYSVPLSEDEETPESSGARRGGRRRAVRTNRGSGQGGDNSNTQFALLGLWAAGRHGFDSDESLESIDGHFRSSQRRDGRWGYRNGMEGSEAMSCAGLMGLAIAASRPSLAERQTARARGAALAADRAFQAALRAVGQDARRAGNHSDIYYLWSLERVCVALGLRSLDGFDWYAHGARILLERQESDGGWPSDRWGRLPSTALALLFLRKANLAFEIDRVLRLPGPSTELAALETASADPAEPQDAQAQPQAQESKSSQSVEPGDTAGADQVKVVVTGASQQAFPRIAVQFEVKRADGSFLLDAGRDDFRVTEEGRDVEVVEFQAPQNKEAIATTIVLVVDRSLSMEEEDRIGGLKTAVRSFLEKLPEGSKVALISFGSDVDRLADFTTDRTKLQAAVDALKPDGATRFYDAVAEGLKLLDREKGRRVVLALTDGEDTFSQDATLESVIGTGQRLGLPVYTLGLGTEEEIESGDLRRLATSTRGQYYPARNAGELRAIYEQIAERIRASYSMVYQSDRKLADGTLRPVKIFYRGGKTAAGGTEIFIQGMVVPAGGWPLLFLGLLCVLAALLVLPSRVMRRALRE